jgi:hypothetical protein
VVIEPGFDRALQILGERVADLDRAAVELDEPLDHGQPQAEAARTITGRRSRHRA